MRERVFTPSPILNYESAAGSKGDYDGNEICTMNTSGFSGTLPPISVDWFQGGTGDLLVVPLFLSLDQDNNGCTKIGAASNVVVIARIDMFVIILILRRKICEEQRQG